MATFQFEGIDDLISQYQKIANDTEAVCGKAIYQGAGVVMKYVTAAVEGIATDDRHGTPEAPCIGPTTYQKEGLLRSVGIAKMRQDGTFYNVKIGFDGYNGVRTKSWPSGQPNSMIARAVQSGTSWMRKQPFLRQAEQAAKAPCEAAMAATVDKELSKYVK